VQTPDFGLRDPGLLRRAVPLLPYQQNWIVDDSKLKIVVKGRQTGFSFAAALRAVIKCLERRRTWVLLSKGERQSKLLMEKVADHIKAMGIAASFHENSYFEGTQIKQLETRFPNGSVIYGLPANPDTARGYSGDVSLDEFAFHADAEKIYSALYPTITRGYGIEVISTPNGQQGKYYELAKAVGLVEWGVGSRESGIGAGVRRPTDSSAQTFALRQPWSAHRVTILDAVAQGLKIDIEALRAGVDDDTWRQEYCCEFLSSAEQWIPQELFQQCVSSEASVVLGALSFASDSRLPTPDSRLYAGWDIARNRDLSVIWLSELVGDVTWTRGVIEMRNVPTPTQMDEARALLGTRIPGRGSRAPSPGVLRMVIDQSGMGLAIREQLTKEFPDKVEGLQFTQQSKERLAVLGKRRMEEMKVRLPDTDAIRRAFRGVKKVSTSTGLARFDSEHDSKYGHADHWWAFCLAEAAAEQPMYHLADVGALIGRPIAGGLRAKIL
jgi:phage FluMu gp28-like protein